MQDSKNIELLFQNLLLHAQFQVNMVPSYEYCYIPSGNMVNNVTKMLHF